MECPLWCVLSDRRRHVEHLWRRRLLVTADERRARRRFLRLMRGFDTEDVDVLRRAVESEGRDARQCAPGPPMDEREEMGPEGAGGMGEDSGLIPQIDRPMSMPYLCCKLWRWRELQVDAALHSLDALPWCRFGRVTINNATVSCCNPFHYALWIRAENSDEPLRANGHLVANMRTGEEPSTSEGGGPPATPPPPPPPPDEDADDDGATIHSNSSLPSTSRPDSRKPSIHRHATAWGEVQRWERADKVAECAALTGPFAAVGLLANSVHDAQPIVTDWDMRNDVSFALIRQTSEDVWLYNSGNRSLFVSIIAGSKADALRRLSPGYCVRIFKGRPQDALDARRHSTLTHASSPRDRHHHHAVISVGAGWGTGYERQCAQDTRVRYEVSFPG